MGTPGEQAPAVRLEQVLVAGADQVNVVHVEQLLTKSGYEVIVSHDGLQAAQVLDSEDAPKLAILDWTMPGMDGVEVCRQLRRKQRHRQTYVILLTRWNEHKDRVTGLEAGADDCLYKPVDVRELNLRLQIGRQILLERALRESEARFQGAFECAGIGMALVGMNGEFLQTNPALCQFLGYTPQELMALNLPQVSHADDTPESQALLQQFLKGETRRGEYERRFVTKKGAVAWASLTVSVILDADQNPTCFVVQAQDIGERRRAVEALQAAHAETELFLQSIPSILIGLDGAGRITRWNPVAAETFEIHEKDALGRNIEECGIKWLHPDLKSDVARWLATEELCDCGEISFERNKKIRCVELQIRRISCQPSENTVFLLTGADITEHRALEDQLRQAQKLEAIGQLAAGIAHEINTPTQYVGDNARFLKESWQEIAEVLQVGQVLRKEAAACTGSSPLLAKFDEACARCDLEYLIQEIPHAIEQSLEGVQRVAKIVRAMKEFSHPGAEEKRGLDINKAVGTTVTVARNEWKYVADMCLHLDESLPLVPCIAGELNQVLLNLVVNAAHAITGLGKPHEKGKICITTRRDGQWVEISVKDSGTGIPEDIRSRVFEPFFTTKSVGQGTGQGLALAHSVIVNRHQGQIWFDSKSGEGTTFFIRLPLEPGMAAS
jgi:PAS domain S-box-containing protein